MVIYFMMVGTPSNSLAEAGDCYPSCLSRDAEDLVEEKHVENILFQWGPNWPNFNGTNRPNIHNPKNPP